MQPGRPCGALNVVRLYRNVSIRNSLRPQIATGISSWPKLYPFLYPSRHFEDTNFFYVSIFVSIYKFTYPSSGGGWSIGKMYVSITVSMLYPSRKHAKWIRQMDTPFGYTHGYIVLFMDTQLVLWIHIMSLLLCDGYTIFRWIQNLSRIFGSGYTFWALDTDLCPNNGYTKELIWIHINVYPCMYPFFKTCIHSGHE